MDTATLMISQQGDSKACIIIFFYLFFFYLDIMLLLATTCLQSLVCGSFLFIMSLSYFYEVGTK